MLRRFTDTDNIYNDPWITEQCSVATIDDVYAVSTNGSSWNLLIHRDSAVGLPYTWDGAFGDDDFPLAFPSKDAAENYLASHFDAWFEQMKLERILMRL